jgi:hypothetical protein
MMAKESESGGAKSSAQAKEPQIYATLGELTDALWAIEDWIRSVREALGGLSSETQIPLRISMYEPGVDPGRKYMRGCPPPSQDDGDTKMYNRGCPPPREKNATGRAPKDLKYNKGCPEPVEAKARSAD